MSRKYKNPPIDEALCEFRFVPTEEWNLTVPGRLFTEFHPEYPTSRNVVHGYEIGSGQLTIDQASAHVQFSDLHGSRRLTVGHNLLGVHVLRPYPSDGWDSFRPMIERALAGAEKVLGSLQIRRLGVRYINRIEVPGADRAVYFNYAPPKVDGLPGVPHAFMHRSEYRFDDGVMLLTTFATVDPSGPDKAAFLLDVDLIWEGPPRPATGIMSFVDDLRNRERVAFEALITDKARELFDA